MSDSNQKEPGRFGDDGAAVIQVTPGQIVGAALFLLVAATIIFFAGVFARGLTMSKTEEEPTVTPPAPLEQENVAVLPAPEPVVPEPEPDPVPPKPAEEEKSPPPKPEPEPEPEPAPEVVKTAPPVIEMKPVKAEAEEPEPMAEVAPPEPEPGPDPEPEASAPEEPTSPPPAESQPEPLPELPPSTSGSFTVQVLSIGVAKRAQAEAYQRDALEDKDVQVTLVESSDGKLIRAYVGSYATRAEAEQARNALVRAGFDGCFIKQRDD